MAVGKEKCRYVEDFQGNRSDWRNDRKWIIRFLKEHPPVYSWVFEIDDHRNIMMTEYNPKRCNGGPTGCKGEVGCDYSFLIHTDDVIDVRTILDVECFNLRDNRNYTKMDTRPNLGLSKATCELCVEKLPPKNYGCGSTFAIGPLKAHEWGYGCRMEVIYRDPHFADGKPFDTYANYDGRCKEPEPSEFELVQYCDRIDVQFTISMDRRSTPTEVIDRAIALCFDERMKMLMDEVMYGKK